MAARLAKEGKFGRMAAFRQQDVWTDIDLNAVTLSAKTINVDEMYDVDTYQPRLSVIWAA
jgi:hypothetical protein